MVDKIRAENEETDKDQLIQSLTANIQSLTDDLKSVEDDNLRLVKLVPKANPDPTHYIVELLQNAEDAIGQNCHPKSRTVQFELTPEALVFSHYGKLFDKKDKDSICRAGVTTKAESKDTIGKFGIGFEFAYDITETPRISSGPAHDPDYHFQINNRRKPEPIKSLNGEDSEKTTIELPFNSGLLEDDLEELIASIGKGLNELDGQTILFLRHITRIEWQTPDGSGFLERTYTNEDTYVRSVTVNSSSQDKVEHWLIFNGEGFLSKEDKATSEDKVNSLEIAFHQSKTDDGNWSITKPGRKLCLSVYFPTEEETDLGFHVQGDFEPTLGRGSLLKGNDWNKSLVEKTGELLVEALLWLKQKKKLDKGVLECLPIEDKFFPGYGRFFEPVARELLGALGEKELLPTARNDYCKAEDAAYLNIAEELGELFNVDRLETLFKHKHPNRCWLSEEECRPLKEVNYLKRRLRIPEIGTEEIINDLDEDFLKDQNDSWFENFYAFLLDQSHQSDLFNAIKKKPILRLEDGRHVCPSSEEKVFQPPKQGETKYTCVKKEVLKGDNGENARKFLEKLDIIEPDLVEDALERIEDYKCEQKTLCITQYKKDLETILDATEAATRGRINKLYKAIEDAAIVLVDTPARKLFKKPDQVYLPNDDLRILIGDKESTFFADETIIKEEMHVWMKDCGAHDHLKMEECQELDYIFCKIRRTADLKEKHALSKKLWDQMKNIKIEYWQATKIKKQLNETAWIPDDDGNLKKPSEILFPKDWVEHPRPFKIIPFMKSEVFDYFMSKGIPEENARALSEKYPTLEAYTEHLNKEAEEHLNKEKPIEISANSDSGDTPHTSDLSDRRPNRNGEPTQPSEHFTGGAVSVAPGKSKTSSGGSKIEIVIEPSDSDIPPNPKAEEDKRKTEEAAVEFILKKYPDLIDANEDNPNNPGYDLHNKEKDKFIEVKGVSGEFTQVSMTITQFEYAMEKRGKYWLYVVENAESDNPKLYRLHDPAGLSANMIIKKEGLDWQE